MNTRSIYVISAPNGYVKVGHARSAYERFYMIQTCSPLLLTFEYLCDCEAPDEIEAEVHEYLDPFHRHGEWFEVAAADAVAAVRLALTKRFAIAASPHRNEGRGAPPKLRPLIKETATYIAHQAA